MALPRRTSVVGSLARTTLLLAGGLVWAEACGGESENGSPQADASTEAGHEEEAGTDVVPCESDNDCRNAGQVCDPLANRCVTCVRDADCEDNAHCRQNDCV